MRRWCICPQRGSERERLTESFIPLFPLFMQVPMRKSTFTVITEMPIFMYVEGKSCLCLKRSKKKRNVPKKERRSVAAANVVLCRDPLLWVSVPCARLVGCCYSQWGGWMGWMGRRAEESEWQEEGCNQRGIGFHFVITCEEYKRIVYPTDGENKRNVYHSNGIG